MTLRKRLSLIAAASVGIAVLIAVVGCYMLVRHQLRSQVDGSLWAQEKEVLQTGIVGQAPPGIPASAGGPAQYVQIVYPGGFHRGSGGLTLPLTQRVLRIANAEGHTFISDVWVGNNHLRMLTMPVTINNQVPAALELARPLSSVDNVLADLRLVLTLLLLGGMAVAAILGRVASRRVLAPLAEVADVAQTIAQTDDLVQAPQRPRRRRGRPARHQLQLDARSPGVLTRGAGRFGPRPAPAHRRRLARAAHAGDEPAHQHRGAVAGRTSSIPRTAAACSPTSWNRARSSARSWATSSSSRAATSAAPRRTTSAWTGWPRSRSTRARRNAPGIHFDATLVPTMVDGVPERLARAINNLLDNAARHSPPGGTVEVQVGPKGVEVRDHGSGVDPDDLPYVFDRFFRGRNSRGRQGSGLGLAIVRQVAEQHGGSVSVTNAVDGGAIFNLWLPGLPADTAADLLAGGVHALDPASGEPIKLR